MRFLRYGERQREAFVILSHFLPFYPTNNTENQNFEKITHMCRRWSTPHNFFLVFTEELEKQIFIKKTAEADQ